MTARVSQPGFERGRKCALAAYPAEAGPRAPYLAMDDRDRLIGLIYEGVANEEVWQQLLALLADRLNAAGAGLGLQDMATHAFRAVADAGIDRGLHDTYIGLAPENRIWQAIGRAGRPMADWMVMPKSELVALPLYSEWVAPQGFHGVMAAPILARESLSGVVVAFCGKRRGDFGERDVNLLAGFAPHLGRAVSMASNGSSFSPSCTPIVSCWTRRKTPSCCSTASCRWSMPTSPPGRCSMAKTDCGCGIAGSLPGTPTTTLDCRPYCAPLPSSANRRRRILR